MENFIKDCQSEFKNGKIDLEGLTNLICKGINKEA